MWWLPGEEAVPGTAKEGRSEEEVEGTDRGKVLLFALSTCVWCKKARRLLKKLGVAYEFVYVDKLSDEDQETAKDDVRKWNKKVSYPTLVVHDEECVVGFSESKIKKALGF